LDCTITCHDDEIVIDAFCGAKRSPATYLSDFVVSCGASLHSPAWCPSTFDKRGQGLSVGISGAPSLEQRVDDVRAIIDAIGSQRAALLGLSEGSAISAFFAATNPERVSKLILIGGFAKASLTEETLAERTKFWGSGAVMGRRRRGCGLIRRRAAHRNGSNRLRIDALTSQGVRFEASVDWCTTCVATMARISAKRLPNENAFA
jgi:pimeloyl-ACP methyl ester carboxylesterase